MAPSAWVFLRHAQCEGNVDRRLVAPDDSPLTTLGWEQAQAAVQQLAPLNVSKILVSPTLRTRQTAEVLGAACPGATVCVLDALRERSFGAMDAWTRDRLDASPWAEARMAWSTAVPGGESLAAVATRAADGLRVHCGADVTLVVSHAGVIRALVGLLDGLPPDEIGRLRVPHAVPWLRCVPPKVWSTLGR